MASLSGFNAADVPPSDGFDPLPAGKYRAQIVASEMRATKDGTGQYLWLELEVVDGQCTGRKVFDRINLVNANPTAVGIAQRTLSAICRAVGILEPHDSEELHFRPLIADVRVRPAQDQYAAANEVKGYGPLSAQTGATATSQHAQAPKPQPTAPATKVAPVPPWLQKNGGAGAAA